MTGRQTSESQDAKGWIYKAGTAMVAGIAVCTVGITFRIASSQYQAKLRNPEFGLIDLGDQSSSFSKAQFQKQVGIERRLYDHIFQSDPVEFRYFTFANDLQEVSTTITMSSEESLRQLRLVVHADPSATRFGPALGMAHECASKCRSRKFVVLIQSDGQATDPSDARKAALVLARDENVRLVIVCGALPEYRLSLRSALAPIGNRLVFAGPLELSDDSLRLLADCVRSIGANK